MPSEKEINFKFSHLTLNTGKMANLTFKITGRILRAQNAKGCGNLCYLRCDVIGYISLNMACYLLLQEKGNTYENRRVLSKYERP